MFIGVNYVLYYVFKSSFVWKLLSSYLLSAYQEGLSWIPRFQLCQSESGIPLYLQKQYHIIFILHLHILLKEPYFLTEPSRAVHVEVDADADVDVDLDVGVLM